MDEITQIQPTQIALRRYKPHHYEEALPGLGYVDVSLAHRLRQPWLRKAELILDLNLSDVRIGAKGEGQLTVALPEESLLEDM